MLSLEHELRLAIHYQLAVDPAVLEIGLDSRTVFAIRSPSNIRTKLERCYQLESADTGSDL